MFEFRAEEFLDNYRRTKGQFHRTPVMTSRTINEVVGAELFFKCENLQRTGSFKFRGVSSALDELGGDGRKKGVAAHSSGNHGQALALGAREYGVPAYIVMPADAVEVKKEAVSAYGAEILESPPTLQGRSEKLEAVVEKTGAAFVPPFKDRAIVRGQATVAMELTEQVGDLTTIVAPVGGGGLMAGMALYLQSFHPSVELIGVEPSKADDVVRSFHAMEPREPLKEQTIADGLRVPVGEENLEVILSCVDDMLGVEDERIIAAMHLIAERMKLVVEPSGAVPLAAVLRTPEKFRGKRVGIILSGGNKT